MSDRVQDLTNHRKVAVACKNYTDKEVKKAKDELITFFSRNTVDTDDHTNELTYQITAPSGAKLLQLMSVGGNTVKLSPSVASDNTSALVKTMPSTVYDFDVSKVEGKSVIYNQLISNGNFANSSNVYTGGNAQKSVNNNILTLTTIDTSVTGNRYGAMGLNLIQNHKYLAITSLYIPTLSSITNSPKTQFAGNYQGTYYYTNIKEVDSSNSSNIGKWLEVGNVVTWTNPTGIFNYNFTFDRVDEIRVKKAQVFDLTAMFGAGNEPSDYETAKAQLLSLGIDVNEYNSYSTGKIRNLELSGLKVEGSNLANPSLFELGSISTASDSIGQDVPNNSRMRSNYIKVKPNTEYTLNYDNYNVNYFQYDEEYRCISNAVGGTFTTGATTKYVRFYGGIIDENTKVLFNEGTNSTYIPYVSQTLPIDLSTILYNGSPLFTNGLCSIGSIKDELTPYKATKRINRIKVSELTINYNSELAIFYTYVTKKFGVTNVSMVGFDTVNKYYTQLTNLEICGVESTQGVNFVDTSCQDLTAFHNKYDNYYIYYEDYYGPIEVSIDWSATLRNIQGYPNGSIIAENTNNMDVESVITYNSIIQETLCDSVTITRNGVDILTRNLPTQASDGWSVGTQRNYRVFCDYEGNEVSKRETNVNKNILGDDNWVYSVVMQSFSLENVIKRPNNSSVANILSKKYTSYTANAVYGKQVEGIAINSSGGMQVNDSAYTDATTFTTAMANEPLYYELADTSKTETDMDDFDYFFDVEEGDVITFNNTYAQQVYATYSFLIKEAKSNE